MKRFQRQLIAGTIGGGAGIGYYLVAGCESG